MVSTTPKLADLVAALPAEAKEPATPTPPLQELLRAISHRRMPIGRLNRLWVLGTLQAKIAVAYLAWWLRCGFTGADERQRSLNETHLRAAIKLLGGMSYLRGAIMKIGQMIATHPNVAPDQFANVLGRLHFESPPMHYSLLREFVRAELNADPADVFDEFETKAFAAASLGQVHRARLKGSGQRVAVKIQYPNIGRTIRDDFRNMMAFLTPMRLSGDWDNTKEVFDDVRRMLTLETDYEQEAENLRLARSAFTEDEGIVVPRVFPEFSTRRVLTMDYIDGVHLDEFLATNPSQQLRDEFGHMITLSCFRLQYAKSMCYADVQPGNYLFMPDGRLGLIDFGCCQRHSAEQFEYLNDAERTFRFMRETRREAARLMCDLRPEQKVEPERVDLIVRMADWAWAPIITEGPYDFSDPAYFRRGVELYGELLRRRYVRSRPVNTWMFKAIAGHRAMMTRLKARVDVGAVLRAESGVRPDPED